MIRGFCQAHDEDPALFRFLLFVQHGQLEQARRRHADAGDGDARRARARLAAGEIPAQDADLATALVFGVVLQPMHVCGLRPAAAGRRCRTGERLVAAAWAAVTTV